MKTEKLLKIVLIMQVVVLASQWAGPLDTARVAQADIPNPGERQLALLDEARQTNARLDKLIALLQSGDVQVKLAKDQPAAK